jgi:hypothetical protein
MAWYVGDSAHLGFRDPSSKHKNHLALALQEGALEARRARVDIKVTRFAEMAEFQALQENPNYADPFDGAFAAFLARKGVLRSIKKACFSMGWAKELSFPLMPVDAGEILQFRTTT